jgi:hypothetical protein
MQANNDVTTALQRVTGRMQEELEKSVLSVQMLGASLPTIASAHAYAAQTTRPQHFRLPPGSTTRSRL